LYLYPIKQEAASPPIAVEYHMFELNDGGEQEEYIDDDEEEGNAPASHHWILPSRCFDGLWDSLIFDIDVKTRVKTISKKGLLIKSLAAHYIIN